MFSHRLHSFSGIHWCEEIQQENSLGLLTLDKKGAAPKGVTK